MSFFFRDVHPVVGFARFRSNAAAVVTQDCTWSSSIEGSISLRRWSVGYVRLLPPPPPFSAAEIVCAIEVNLLVSADHLSGSSSNLVL